MLTAPSPPFQHRSTPPDSFLASLDPPPTRSLSRALRFSTNTDFFQKSAKPADSRNPGAPRLRSFSMVPSAKSSSKGKEHGVFDPLEAPSFPGSLAFDDMIPLSHKSARGAALSRPATADSSLTPTAGGLRRNRGSILGVASDALRFGRRRKSIKELPPPPPPRLLLPDVIEVRASAHTPTLDEDEEAEREQLRAAAVQSVGFDVNISRPPPDREPTFGDHGDGDADDISHSQKEGQDAHAHQHGNERALPSIHPHPPKLPPAADPGLSDVSQPARTRSRGRMSSPAILKLVHPSTPPTTTTAPNEVLTFPSTRAQLATHEQLSATLPKHYPPPSLLMLALSKQWRARHVVLSVPVLAGASYLHIFKSNAPDERELERLEINERSVVFVNDEDVGGRRGVVRVGGVDVGALRRDLNGEENGMTMMMLQIVDANESQNWINAIKNVVLGQRSIRAGLGIPSNSSSVPEPRGDLDVMLSMRMQGMLHSPVKSSFNSPDDTSKPEQNGSTEETAPTPRPPSLRSRPSSPRSPNGVLSLKSLFSVSGSGTTRPRSPSLARTTSPDVASGESFSSAASSLLGMRTVADSPLIKPYSMLPPTGPALDPTAQIQRKIIDPQPNLDWTPLENPNPTSKLPLSMPPPPRPMSPSLNPPPPRKRAYTTNEPRQAPSSSDSGQLVYNHGNASTAGSFGVPVPDSTRPSLERAWSERGKPRASSVSSNSTTTENGSARRWSRQSSNLLRPTPPPDDSPTPVSTVPHPPPWQNGALPSHDNERSPSRTSSQSQKTLPSIISSLHVASKRTSTSSSVFSIATTSSSTQHVGGFSKSRGSHRLSMPPPRPAPSSALPPTPTGSDTEGTAASQATVKPLRRNSLARRALRLSLGQPAPTLANDGYPNTAPVTRSHSRSTSVDSVPHSTLSHGLAISPVSLVPPAPPPTGPLPPPPLVAPTPIHAPLPTVPRTTSLKQRLRILSAPAGRSTPPPAPTITAVVHPTLTALEIPTSIPPRTPICEPITHIGPDADFLHLDGETPIATLPPKAPAALGAPLPTGRDESDGTPVLSLLSFPPPPPLPTHRYRRSLPPPPDRSPQQMTVLSPPPRKGSIRPLPSPSPEQERGQSVARDDEEMLPLTPPPLDLVRNTSTLSLSIVSGAV